MPEIIKANSELIVNYTPPVIESNLPELKEYIAQELEPFKGVELDISDKDKIKEAKAVYADLNKLKEKVKKRRIELTKEYKKPLTTIEAGLKEIEQDLESAYREGKSQLDAVALKEQEARRAEMMLDYEGIVGDIAELIAFEAIENPSWCKSSYGKVKADKELEEKANSLLEEIASLKSSNLEYEAEALAVYYSTAQISDALNENKRLVEKAERLKELKQRETKVFGIETPTFVEVAPPSAPQAATVHETANYEVVLMGVTVFDAKEVARSAEAITGKKVTLRKVK